MKKYPKLTPTRYDALLAAVVLLLAAALGARLWTSPPGAAGAVVVSIDGAAVERVALGEWSRTYAANGYTVRVEATAGGVRVAASDCPTQDCVRTGTITRAGQSIVCLPARLVVTLTGAAEYDAVAG